MTVSIQDGDLVADYAARGSEGAFRAVVARHADLVFATALRQCGDRGLAEEVAQNVFIALARKAPRLAGHQTLGGWLHRAAVLEARARIRAELRRRERELAAADLAAISRGGDNPLEAAEPLLDEGLLSLREPDRQVLISRFFENKPLREVGAALGIDEDAARKRVSRALDKLAGFFQGKGFSVSGAAGAAALCLRGAEACAPTGFAAAAAGASLGAAGGASSFNLFLLKMTALSKLKTGVVCALLAAAPLAWQWQTNATLADREAALRTEALAASGEVASLAASQQQWNRKWEEASARRLTAEASAGAWKKQREGKIPRPVYAWSDDSPLVRVPKAMLKSIRLSAVASRQGQISDLMRQTLQMSDSEAELAQGALDQFLISMSAAQKEKMRKIELSPKDPGGLKPDEVMAFEMGDTKDQFRALRAAMLRQVEEALGPERAERFREGLADWIPMEDQYSGIKSSYVLLENAHEIRFYRPAPGQEHIAWGMSRGGSSFTSALSLEEIPEMFRPHLQEWIDRARSAPPEPNRAIKGGSDAPQ